MADEPIVQIIGLKEVTEYFKKLPETMYMQTRDVFVDATLAAQGKTQSNLNTRMKKRTGALSRSIQTDVSGKDLDNLRASVFSAQTVGGQEIKYAPVHEFGANIRALDKYMGVPGGPYLNIPTEANKTASGVMRLPASQVFAQGGYVRSIGRGRFGVFLGENMMFSLHKSVSIPPRMGMTDAATDEIPTILSKLNALIGSEK